MLLPCILFGINKVSPIAAEDFYPDFALVIHVPSYEAFLTNLGDSSIRIDGYAITSRVGITQPCSLGALNSAGPEIVAALGHGADGFFMSNPTQSSLAEFNLLGSATWQPGQSWSVGFPFELDDPNFSLDAVFRFSSPNGLVLTGGTVGSARRIFPGGGAGGPEPSTLLLTTFSVAITSCLWQRRAA